jgi:hypothetical protein
MSDRDLEAKFRDNTRARLTPGQQDAALDAVWNFEKCDDVGKLMGLLTV